MTAGIFNSTIGQLDLQEIRRYAGLRSTPFPAGLITQAAEDVCLRAVPQGSWHRYDYNATAGTVESVPPFPLSGQAVRRHLADAVQVILLAVTIGEAVEAAGSEYFAAGEYTRAALLDAAATTAVEKIADDLERSLRNQLAKEGYCLGQRFSPGYGDWELSAQRQVLPLSGGADLGISLTSGLMLLPRKSVTAICGLYPRSSTAPLPPAHRGCQNCPKTDCPARRPLLQETAE